MEQALTIYQFDNEYYLNRNEFLNKVQNKVLEFFVDIDNKSENFSFQGTVGDYANEIILGKVIIPIDDICLLKYNNGKLENIGCENDSVQVKLSVVINQEIVGVE